MSEANKMIFNTAAFALLLVVLSCNFCASVNGVTASTGDLTARLNGKGMASQPTKTANETYQCSGLCCSSNPRKFSASWPSMLSRWLSNSMYNNSKVHIWSWVLNSNWGPGNGQLGSWTGTLTALRNQTLRNATISITIIRLSNTTVRLRVPGGRFIEARNDSRLYFNANATRYTIFKFIQIGSGYIQFLTAFNTYISLGAKDILYHHAVKPSKSETFLIYEVMQVPSFRGVSLGGWLFIEGDISPNLFTGVPKLVDGHQMSLQSVVTKGWLNSVKNKIASSTTKSKLAIKFVLRTVNYPQPTIQLRNTATYSYFVLSGANIVEVNTTTPNASSIFTIHTYPGNENLVMLQASNGNFLRVSDSNILADIPASAIKLSSYHAWSGVTAFKALDLATIRSTYQLCIGLSTKVCQSRLNNHWKTYVLESDWKWISKNNLNAVRLTIPYWFYKGNKTDYPFPPGGYQYLDWAFEMAVKYNVQIFLSMHSTPGSNNVLETRDGIYEFGILPGSVNTMLAAVDWAAKRYSSNPMLAGIGLINEPYGTISHSQIYNYYSTATAIIRKYSKCAFVAYNTRLGDSKEYTSFPNFATGVSNVIEDQHPYKLFGPSWPKVPIQEIISLTRSSDSALIKSIQAGSLAYAMIGEFSVAVASPVKNRSLYQDYATAELTVYSQAIAGWFYWSYEGGFPWSFKYLVENGMIKQKGGHW